MYCHIQLIRDYRRAIQSEVAVWSQRFLQSKAKQALLYTLRLLSPVWVLPPTVCLCVCVCVHVCMSVSMKDVHSNLFVWDRKEGEDGCDCSISWSTQIVIKINGTYRALFYSIWVLKALSIICLIHLMTHPYVSIPTSIYSFIHTLTQMLLGQLGVWYFAQGYFGT